MTAFCSRMNSWRRTARMATFVMFIATAWVDGAGAQTPPYALFQYSTVTGSGNTLTATQLPVVTANGISYQNVTLLFDVDSEGNLTLAPNYPVIVQSTRPIMSAFRAGTYVGPPTILSGKATINVSGPSVGPGGVTEFSLVAASGADPCTYPSMGTWYVVGSVLANNPYASRIKAAGITSTLVSYGIGSSQCNTDDDDWEQDTLLGFSQVGNKLTISSYTFNGGDDFNTPKDVIVYTLQTP